MKSLALSLTLSLVLALFCPSPGRAATEHSDEAQLRVSVFNVSPISRDTLQQAQEEASRVLRDAGVNVIWLHCPQDTLQEASLGRCSEASFPAHLHLHIARSSRSLKPSVLGIAFLGADGQGCYSDLFYEPLQKLQRESHVALSVVLGYAMAHELGHLLLGVNSHSPTGLMRAHWQRDDFTKASNGDLRFSRKESLRIRNRFAQSGVPKSATYGDGAELAGVEKPK